MNPFLFAGTLLAVAVISFCAGMKIAFWLVDRMVDRTTNSQRWD